MSLLIRVGFQRRKKLRGEAISVSCALQVELPAELLSGAGATLQRRAEIAFDACRDAVHTELARYRDETTSSGKVTSLTREKKRIHRGLVRKTTRKQSP